MNTKDFRAAPAMTFKHVHLEIVSALLLFVFLLFLFHVTVERYRPCGIATPSHVFPSRQWGGGRRTRKTTSEDGARSRDVNSVNVSFQASHVASVGVCLSATGKRLPIGQGPETFRFLLLSLQHSVCVLVCSEGILWSGGWGGGEEEVVLLCFFAGFVEPF